MRPLCTVCRFNVTDKLKSGNYRKKCRSCGSANGRATGKFTYKFFKKDHCENPDCPLQGSHYEPYILDVDHIDGNKLNEDPSNLITLCCVCHRRKTHESRDFVRLDYRSKL